MVQIHPSLFCLSCLVVYLHITRISTPSFSGLVLAGLGWPGPAGSKFEGTSASFLPSRESSPHVHPRVSNFHDMESIKQFSVQVKLKRSSVRFDCKRGVAGTCYIVLHGSHKDCKQVVRIHSSQFLALMNQCTHCICCIFDFISDSRYPR